MVVNSGQMLKVDDPPELTEKLNENEKKSI